MRHGKLLHNARTENAAQVFYTFFGVWLNCNILQSLPTYFWWKTGFRVIGRISVDILSRNIHWSCQGNPNPGDDRLTARFRLSAWNVVHITMHVTVGRTSSQIELQIAYIWAPVRLFTLFFDRIRISWNNQVFVIEKRGDFRCLYYLLAVASCCFVVVAKRWSWWRWSKGLYLLRCWLLS